MPSNKTDQETSESDQSENIRLKRRLGLVDGVAIIMGVIIGSGIFISPAGVIREAGSIGASLLVWSTCGLLSLMGALCMAELGTSIKESGGDYSYIKLAYGPLMSFLYLWVSFLIILPCSNAVAALTFARYVIQPFFNPECETPQNAVRFFAFAIVLILVWVNCYSVKWSLRLQDSFTALKVLALGLIIAIGFYYIVAGKANKLYVYENWFNAAKPLTITGFTTAFYSGFYSYAGWNSLNFITEEIKNPVKNMPRAIIISITSITVIYVLVNLAYFAVLTESDIEKSGALAVTFGEQTMGGFSFLMPLSVALSTTSGLNALIFSSSRVLFVGARQGQLFSLLNMISVNHVTPMPSLIVVGLMSLLYLVTTQIMSLISYLVFIEASIGALAVSTVLVLRYKLPDTPRPIRVYTYIPVIYLVASFVFIVIPIYTQPYETLLGLVILLTGLPAYYLTANWKKKPRLYQKAIDTLNVVTQKLTLSVISEKADLDD